MKFTFWAVGAPLMLAVIAALFALDRSMGGLAGLTALVWGPWLLVGAPATTIYWIVRLVRRSWSDGSARSSARPAGWIYPDER